MNTTTIVVIVIVVVIIVMVVLRNKSQTKELNANLKFIIDSINEDPELLSRLSYDELVELEEVLNYFYYNQGKELVSNQTYDKIKNKRIQTKEMYRALAPDFQNQFVTPTPKKKV